ncbi:MAG TPA: NmrA family NAD(P)-binding protein [Terriglobales bacterium]|nr:NmrA family NAD(P)-binding protein [Terriglobales bacterium]
MNNLKDKNKDKVAGSTDAIYVILGASGNTGSIIADSLLSKGKKVRVVGRDAGRLQRFVRQGAEAFTGNVSDAIALTKAFSGTRAAYLMLPPITSREDQERESDAIAQAVRESGLRCAVHLSSYGAHVPEGTGPVTGLHSSEQKLNAIGGLNVLHLRAAYYMENNLAAISMIQGMGVFGHALLPDLKLPMIATRDVGDYAAQRLLDLDFSGKQTRELLGERDLSMAEATTIIARGIGKPDLRYEQFPYDQVQQGLEQMGMRPKKAAVYIEMFKSINASVLAAQEPRTRENTTPTSFEQFVQDVFAPAYHWKARTA